MDASTHSTNHVNRVVKKLYQSVAVLLAGLPLLTARSYSATGPTDAARTPDPLDPISLRPLNLPGENLFAGHRSHSSHSSHRSSSGGGYVPSPVPQRAAPSRPPPPPLLPVAPAPTPPQRAAPGSGLSGGSQPVDLGRPAAVSPKSAPAPAPAAPTLTLDQKRRLQIMRVQIALTSLGLFNGNIDGVLSDETRLALKRFQLVKGQPESGLMTTETLNALGVPAVQ